MYENIEINAGLTLETAASIMTIKSIAFFYFDKTNCLWWKLKLSVGKTIPRN